MTKRHIKIIASLVGGLGLLLGAAAVQAGYKSESSVGISTYASYRAGYGAMGTARNSTDSNQQVGCSVESGSSYVFARCIARTAAGAYLECTSGSASIVQAALAIGSASRIYFTEDLAGTCTGLHVTNYSNYKPMVP